MSNWVTLEGYIVRRTTDRAVALVKEGAGPMSDLIWVPRSCVVDGEIMEVGDVDVICTESIADEKGLDY